MITTIKEKLKMDLKFVLKYQMETGDSLYNIPATYTFEDMENRIKSISPGYHNYYKRHDYDLIRNYQNVDDVFNDFKIFKFLKGKIDVFIIRYENNGESVRVEWKDKDMEDVIDHLIENNVLSNGKRLSINISRMNGERKMFIEVFGCQYKTSDKLIEHLKTDIKTVLDYNISGFGTISHIVKFKTNLNMMKNRLRSKRMKTRFKTFVSLDDLLKIDRNGLKNHSIKLTLLDGSRTMYKVDGLDTYEKIILYVNKREKEEGVLLRSQYISLRKEISEYTENGVEKIDIKHTTVIDLEFDDEPLEIHEDDIAKHLPEFNKYKFTHGLVAYNDFMNLNEKLEGLKNKDITICCCWEKEYVGDFGIYITGDCIHASLYDLCSRYDNGKRIIESSNFFKYGSISSPNQIILTRDMNGEALVKNFKVVGVWVRLSYFMPYKNNINTKIMNILNVKNKFNVPITIIDDRDDPKSIIYHGNKKIELT